MSTLPSVEDSARRRDRRTRQRPARAGGASPRRRRRCSRRPSISSPAGGGGSRSSAANACRDAVRCSSGREPGAGALLPYEAFMLARALGRRARPRSRAVRPLVDAGCSSCRVVGATLRALGRRPATSPRRAPCWRPASGHRVSRRARRRRKPLAQRYRLAPFRAPLLRCGGRGRRADRAGGGHRRRGGAARRGAASSGSAACSACPRSRSPRVPGPAADQVDGPRRRAARRGRPHGADRADAMRASSGQRVRERLQGLVSDGVRRRRAGLFA